MHPLRDRRSQAETTCSYPDMMGNIEQFTTTHVELVNRSVMCEHLTGTNLVMRDIDILYLLKYCIYCVLCTIVALYLGRPGGYQNRVGVMSIQGGHIKLDGKDPPTVHQNFPQSTHIRSYLVTLPVFEEKEYTHCPF